MNTSDVLVVKIYFDLHECGKSPPTIVIQSKEWHRNKPLGE